MVLGKFIRYVQKRETRPFSYTTHKNKFKMYVRPETIKFLEENIASKISGIACSTAFSDISLPARKTRKT